MKYISKLLLLLLTISVIASAFSGFAVNVTAATAVAATQNFFEYEMEPGDRIFITKGGLTFTAGSITNCVVASNNTDVATVNGGGLITAVGYGTAAITVVNEENSLMFIFSVSVKKPAEKITIDQTDRIMFKGETFRLTYTVPKDQKAGNVTWSSSNNAIAKVSANGMVEAVGVGTAIITASSEYGVKASYVAEVVELDDSVSVVNARTGDLSFESSSYGTGWTGRAYGSGSRTWVSGGANGSKGCMKIEITSEDGDFYAQPYFNDGDVKPGERYTFSCWVNVENVSGGTASITIGCSPYGYLVTKSFTEKTDGWEKISFDFLIPQGGTTLSLMLRLQGIGKVYYDEVRFTRQKDVTDVRLFSDGLALNSLVKNAPLTNANIHYAPKATGASKLITAVYEGKELKDVKSTSVTATSSIPQTIELPVDLSKLGENQYLGIMNWRDLKGIAPLDQKRTFLEKTQRSDVYNFFEINRMRGVYGGISDIYSEDIKALITEKGINTLILNIIGTFYEKNIAKDKTVLNKVLADAEKLADETGVKIFPKISYGSSNSNDSTIHNTAYGEFHSGDVLVDKSGQVVSRTYLPCPRAREYWKKMITENLSVVAAHKKLVGGVVDMEMYSGYRTSYGGTCKCDTCVADFDAVYGTNVAAQTITERYAYVAEQGLTEEYNAWHKAEITDITSEVRETLHKINPDFIIGCMPTFEWIAGTTEGLGTHNMPLMVFDENQYKGDMSKMYVNQATIKLKDLPAVYATGLWATQNTSANSYIAPSAFASKAVEAAENSMGYWIYSSNYLVGTGNTEEENAEYVAAVKSANDTIDEKYGL